MDLSRRMSEPVAVRRFPQLPLRCSLLRCASGLKIPSLLWLTASIAAAITVNELVGKPVPFLRWSVLTMMLEGGTC